MKNKLKKSKIIVPALALITATTAASVTGTVAWFTASRTVTVTASQFESTSETSNLKVKTATLVGTETPTDKAGSNASISVAGKLTHGSYNAQAITNSAQGNLYVAHFGGDDGTITGYDDKGTITAAKTSDPAQTEEQHSKWIAQLAQEGVTGSKDVWYAVAWTMTFSLDNVGVDDPDTHLFFDPTTTTFTDTSTGTKTKTLNGFRIALMTSTEVSVVGGHDDSTIAESHVVSAWSNETGSASAHVASFASGVYNYAGKDVTKAVDAAKDTLEAHSCHLGTIDKTDGLTVTAVAWFEGEDSSVVNSSDMSTVAASLKFYARSEKASA